MLLLDSEHQEVIWNLFLENKTFLLLFSTLMFACYSVFTLLQTKHFPDKV